MKGVLPLCVILAASLVVGTLSSASSPFFEYSATCPVNFAPPKCQTKYCQAGQFNCDCDFGYEGEQCADTKPFCNHTAVMHNSSATIVPICSDHGVCTDSPSGASCQCDPGWTGTFCQHYLDDCDPNPCQNNGTCINLMGVGYDCLCDKFHVGQNCEHHKDFCNHEQIYYGNGVVTNVHICGDHGNCQNSDSGSYCTCDHGWTGTFCEHEIEYNCTAGGQIHPHGSTWNDRCNTCNCMYGNVTCSEGYWCPQRCAIFNTPKVQAHGITVGCPTRENCIPDTVECARENPACDFPIGWCFPVGVVMLEQLSTPSSV